MSQKIDIHGLFIDPLTIEDLRLDKRISVFYPVFHEVESLKSFFGRFSSSGHQHVLQFDHQEPYGIILADAEQPDPSNYVIIYKEAVFEQLRKGIVKAGNEIKGHLTEMLKIDISGDRQYRILQSGRVIKQTTIREIPAKAKLLTGQWVDVFKSTPEYDFQGATPYAVAEVASSSLMIRTKDKTYALFGAGVDMSDEEVINAYSGLTQIYNQIQIKKAEALEEKKGQPLFRFSQINIQLPKVELPKIEIPQIRLQSPFAFVKKQEENDVKALPGSDPNDTKDK